MEYADVFWDRCTESERDLLEHVQYEAAKIVTGAMKETSKHRVMQELGWEDLKTRRAIHKLLLYFKIVNNFCPSYLVDLLPLQVSERTTYSFRTESNYSLLASCTERFKIHFFPQLLPCGMTLVLTSNPSALLKKVYFPFTMYLVITLLMILLLIDLMQFSTLVYV